LELLLYGGERRVIERGGGKIVKPHHRAAFRYLPSSFPERGNCGTSGEVIKNYNSAELAAPLQQFIRELATPDIRWIPTLNLQHRVGIDHQPDIARESFQPAPALLAISQDLRSLDECNSTTPQFIKILQCLSCTRAVVYHDGAHGPAPQLPANNDRRN